MHKITDAINDDEPYIRGVVDGVANRMMALRISGSAMALKWLKCNTRAHGQVEVQPSVRCAA